jgi:hypothetical protein
MSDSCEGLLELPIKTVKTWRTPCGFDRFTACRIKTLSVALPIKRPTVLEAMNLPKPAAEVNFITAVGAGLVPARGFLSVRVLTKERRAEDLSLPLHAFIWSHSE